MRKGIITDGTIPAGKVIDNDAIIFGEHVVVDGSRTRRCMAGVPWEAKNTRPTGCHLRRVNIRTHNN